MAFLCAWLGNSAPLSAAEGRLADFSQMMRRFGVDDGLMGGRINAVDQSPDGMLWVASERGVFRFDGQHFLPIETESVPGFAATWITLLCASPDGDVWFLNGKNQIAVHHNGTTTAVPFPREDFGFGLWKAHPRGGVLVQLRNDRTKESMLVHFTKAGPAILTEECPFALTALHMEKDGRIWVGTAGGSIMGFKDGSFVAEDRGVGEGTGVFLEGRQGNLIGVARSGIFSRQDGEWRPLIRFALPLQSPPHFAIEDRNGRIWFGDRDRDHQVWEAGKEPLAFRDGRHSLPSVIQQALADRDGNLWFASYSGLYQARYVPFITWKPPLELPTERIVGVRAHRDGTAWFYGFGGMNRLSPGAPEAVLEQTWAGGDLIIGDGDSIGRVWLVNRHGRTWMQHGNERTEIPVPALKERFSPVSLLVAEDGMVWLCTTPPRHVFRCDPNKTPLEFELMSGKNGLPPEQNAMLRALPDGSLLVQSLGTGIFRRERGADTWQRITPPGDRNGALAHFADYHARSGVWSVSREQQLTHWGQGTSQRCPLDQVGLGSVELVGMTLDSIGGIWFATRNHGVVMARTDDLIRGMEDASHDPEWFWFGPEDGLGSLGGSYATGCLEASADGRIWVANDGGLSVIDPGQWWMERERARPLEIGAESWSADGERIPSASPIQVPAGTARLAVQLFNHSFGFPGETTYQHRMPGVSDAWIDIGSRDDLFFQNLDPGAYQLEVLATNRFGIANPEPFRARIEVAPYWWQRAVVQVFGGLLLAGLIAWLVHLRLRYLRRESALHADYSRRLIASQEEERRKIAHELHDSLGQEMLVLKGRIDLTAMKKPELEPVLEELSDQFSETIERARSLSHDLRPPQLEHFGLPKALEALAREVDEAAVIEVKYDIDPIEPRLAPEQEIGLYRIAQEAMSNVLKHSEAREATLALHRRGKTLTLSVRDDGRGFDPDGRGKESLGLTGTHSQVKFAFEHRDAL